MNLASFIDHTLLKADCTQYEIKKCCDEAVQYNMAAVCVPPFYVNYASELVQHSDIKIATVIGFPLGYNTTFIKVEEAHKAIEDGAHELDMVMNISAFKSKQFSSVKNDIDSVCTMAHLHNKKLKVIIESGLLNEEEIKMACKICVDAGVDFVKTSTGMLGNGASVETVKLIKSLLPPHMQVKASGSIRTKQFALDLINAGASRIGTSASVSILNEA